jgi:hypothetical protein
MDISDWAKNLVERKKKELEERRIKQEKELKERNLVEARIEPMWKEVRDAAQKATEELNKGLGQQYIFFLRGEDGDRFNLKVEGTDNVVRIDRAAWTIFGARGKSYRLAVIGETVVWKYHPMDYTSEQIARDEVQQAFEGEDLAAKAENQKKEEVEKEKKKENGAANKEGKEPGSANKESNEAGAANTDKQAGAGNKEAAK